jgi:hypothetical protein
VDDTDEVEKNDVGWAEIKKDICPGQKKEGQADRTVERDGGKRSKSRRARGAGKRMMQLTLISSGWARFNLTFYHHCQTMSQISSVVILPIGFLNMLYVPLYAMATHSNHLFWARISVGCGKGVCRRKQWAEQRYNSIHRARRQPAPAACC